MSDFPLNKYGVADRQPFIISEDPNDGFNYQSLHIIDKDGNTAFTVWPFPNDSDAATPFNTEEMWERANNLLSYFNLGDINPTGEFF